MLSLSDHQLVQLHHAISLLPALFSSLALATFFVWLIMAKNRLAEPLLFCTILTGSVLAMALELMSVIGAVTLTNIRIASIGAGLFCGAVTFYFRRQLVFSEDILTADYFSSDSSLTIFGFDAPILRRLSVLLAGTLIFILLTATAFTALSSVPNDYDSMTYHLPRIEHWLQNRSLEFYPTSILRQLESNILAEEFILIFRSFSDVYTFANMVQWFSFCGCILVVGGITRELGGSRSAQYLSSIMMATLPIAILESSSTQTDLVVAFFSVASIYYLLRVRVGQPYCLLYGAVLAAALAWHAKGTAAVFLSGFVAVYGGGLVLKAKSRRFWIHAVVATVVALLIVGAQLHRNINKFGAAIGPTSQLMRTVEPNWRSTLFNAARNLASNAGDRAAAWVDWTGRALNVADTDERYSVHGDPFRLPSIDAPKRSLLTPHESYAPNPAHVIVLLLSIIVLSVLTLVSTKWRGHFRPLARYGVAAGISVLAFCVLLKWQPFMTRYQSGEFALAIPLAAVAISNLTVAPSILMLVLGFLALPATFHNALRPIIGARSIISASPNDLLFANIGFEAGYVRLADKIVELRPKQVSLVTGEDPTSDGSDEFEFPLWYLLRQRLQASDMPVIIDEVKGQVTDPHSDVVVYLDRANNAVPDGMVEIPGFDPWRLYQRIR